MTVFRHFQPDYQGDYRVTTGQTLPFACGSHFSERKSTELTANPVPVVRAVVSKNGRNPRLTTPLTTDYSLDIKKEEKRKNRAVKEYARARGSRSHPVSPEVLNHPPTPKTRNTTEIA